MKTSIQDPVFEGKDLEDVTVVVDGVKTPKTGN
jgi:hypothetical protein